MNISHGFTRRLAGIKPNLFETVLFGLMMSGPPKLRARDALASYSGSVDSSILFSALVWGIGFLWVFHQFNRYALFNKKLPKINGTVKLAVIYGLTLLLSVFMSTAVFVTAFRSFQVIMAPLFCYFWVRRFGIETTLRHMVGTCLVLVTMVLWAMAFAPDLVYAGGGERIRGDLIANPGSLALITFIIIFNVPAVIKNRTLFLGIVSLFAIMLIIAQTRTYFVLIAVFFILALLRQPQSGRMRFGLYLSVLIIPVLIMVGAVASISTFVVRDEQSLEGLNGRTPVWDFVIERVMQDSPIFGVGFQANRLLLFEVNEDLGNSHNAYLEIFSGGGMLSFGAFLVLLTPILVYAGWLYVRYGHRPHVFVAVTLLYTLLISGFTSQTLVVPNTESFSFWMAVILIPMLFHQTRQEAQMKKTQQLTQLYTHIPRRPVGTTPDPLGQTS